MPLAASQPQQLLCRTSYIISSKLGARSQGDASNWCLFANSQGKARTWNFFPSDDSYNPWPPGLLNERPNIEEFL